MRSNSGGWQGAFHPVGHGVRDGQWHGPAFELLSHIADESGFIINITEPPAEIMDNLGSNSSFTKCVYATALGYLDVCVAMFTLTPVRERLTTFGQIEAAPVYVISFEASTRHRIMRGFVLWTTPFSPGAWLLIGATLLSISLVFVVQEGHMDGSMFERNDSELKAPCKSEPKATEQSADDQHPQRLGGQGPRRPSCTEEVKAQRGKLRKSVELVPEAVYFSFRSFVGAACELQAVSWGGRITILTFGLFIFITTTVYQVCHSHLSNLCLRSTPPSTLPSTPPSAPLIPSFPSLPEHANDPDGEQSKVWHRQ